MMCRKKAIRVLHFCFLRLLNEKMSVRFKTHLQNQKAKSPLLYENTSGGICLILSDNTHMHRNAPHKTSEKRKLCSEKADESFKAKETAMNESQPKVCRVPMSKTKV